MNLECKNPELLITESLNVDGGLVRRGHMAYKTVLVFLDLSYKCMHCSEVT